MNQKKSIIKSIGSFFAWIGKDLKEIGVTFAKGSWQTRLSFLLIGFGQLVRKQFARGLAVLAAAVGLLYYIFGFGMSYLVDLPTLGTKGRGFNPDGTVSYGDNSFLILLFSLVTIVAILAFVFIWRVNVRQNYQADNLLREGKKLPTNRQDLYSLLDENFDKTLLALPVLGIFVFTVLPIIFMICVAFTNYDFNHQPPAKLFTWVGSENFAQLISMDTAGLGSTFFSVLGWTLIWAFFATFLNYFLGMGVAMLINKKGIKFKKLWRTILVLTIAIPQFVSLLYIGKMFASDGLINSWLMNAGIIDRAIPFWTNKNYARVLIILINLWVGIPYMMLIATGLLMNIPADLYESAKIDGATNMQMFRRITLPYMLHVTGPFLLTQFIGNINNFNVIFLLSQGGPTSVNLEGGAGYTDLLITWLYKMTVTNTNYRMAAVIGIMVFIVSAVISLCVYNILPSVKDEEGFQ